MLRLVPLSVPISSHRYFWVSFTFEISEDKENKKNEDLDEIPSEG